MASLTARLGHACVRLARPSARVPHPCTTSSIATSRKYHVCKSSLLLTFARNLSVGLRWKVGGTWSRSKKVSQISAAVETVPTVNTAVGKEAVIERIKEAVGYSDYEAAQRIVLQGEERQRGMTSSWTMSFDSSGRFLEESVGTELSNSVGFDGTHPEALPWEADHAGRVALLELDDKEMLLIDMWVRTSFWLSDKAKKWLSVELLEENALEAVFTLKVIDGAVIGKLHVDKTTWLPQRLVATAYGSAEVWEYTNWRKMQPDSGCEFPTTLLCTPTAGGQDSILVTSMTFSTENAAIYNKPAEPLQRIGQSMQTASWDASVPSKVPVKYTKSGHMLVRPKVNGQDLGYFIFDSGASGLTIGKREADKLGMSSFGEFNVAVIAGEYQCPFRRGESFQLGPLQIDNPLFMEVPGEGIIQEPLDALVAGICGYDVFHYAVVEMAISPEASLTLHKPKDFTVDENMLAMFQRLYVVGYVPQCSALFGRNSGLFMIDTGAGGVDIIFPRRAVEKYELMKGRVRQGAANVRGVPHTSPNECITVHQAEFHHFVLGGYAFETPKQALFALGEQDGFDLSEHTCGIICLNMLKGFRIFFDYPNRRVAFIRQKGFRDKQPEDYDFVAQWQQAFGVGVDMGDKAWEL